MDVVLALLIIFMVVTPLVEKELEVHLPDQQEDPAHELAPEQQAQLVVQIGAGGELVLNAERFATVEAYGERLKRALAAKRKGDRLVFFLPDDRANYAAVVEALEVAKVAGADILGMVTMELPPQSYAPAPPP